jgi:hypothetical protein
METNFGYSPSGFIIILELFSFAFANIVDIEDIVVGLGDASRWKGEENVFGCL